jgi:hypothetical protein
MKQKSRDWDLTLELSCHAGCPTVLAFTDWYMHVNKKWPSVLNPYNMFTSLFLYSCIKTVFNHKLTAYYIN